MNEKDREPILAIALMAALADGQATAEEKARLQSIGTRLGLADMDLLAGRVAMGGLALSDVAARLSDAEARQTAFETAVTVCNSDGTANAQETRFLMELRPLLGLDAATAAATEAEAAAIAGAPVAGPAVSTGTPPSPAGIDELIQKQAIITGALEILPDRLANLAIIPLQLRMVYQIGQAYGQQMDAEPGEGPRRCPRHRRGGAGGGKRGAEAPRRTRGGPARAHPWRDHGARRGGRRLVRVHLRAWARRQAVLRAGPQPQRRGPQDAVHPLPGGGEGALPEGGAADPRAGTVGEREAAAQPARLSPCNQPDPSR